MSHETPFQIDKKLLSGFSSAMNNYYPLTVANNKEVKPMAQILAERFEAAAFTMIPPMDFEDLMNQKNENKGKRQFDATYSQASYNTMLAKEIVVIPADNKYWKNQKRVQDQERRELVLVIEELCRLKSYKEDTLYIACSIADRYIFSLFKSNHSPECLMNLAVTAILMAAKLEQPISPSINRMIKLVYDEWQIELEKQDLIDLEEDVIRELDFEMHLPYPVLFLERFQRIFGLDKMTSKEGQAIDQLARTFCRDFLKENIFLKFKPSHVAAAALTLAMNLSQSKLAKKISLKKFKGLFRLKYFKTEISETERKKFGPLAEWCSEIETLTSIKKCDVSIPYTWILEHINKEMLQNKLVDDADLFTVSNPSRKRENSSSLEGVV